MKKTIKKFIKHKKIKKAILFLTQNKKTVISFIIAIIFSDIAFLMESSDLMIFTILFLYVVFTKMFKIKSRFTFLLCLGLLGVMFAYYIFSHASIQTEKAAVWLILFLGIGVIQQWRE